MTLRQLARMTSGYADYSLGNQPFEHAIYATPFRQSTTDEMLSYAIGTPP